MFHFTLIFILKVYTALNYCILCLLCLLVSKYLYFIETKPFSCTVCEVNFTEIQSLVSHFDQYHAFEKRNEDHVNQKTESGGKKKCPHCSQQFSRLDTKHIKKCEKYSKYIEYGSNRFTCRLCTGSKKSRNRKHIYKLYSHIDEHLSKEVSKENEQSPSEANLDKTLLKTSPEETKFMESIISKRISKEREGSLSPGENSTTSFAPFSCQYQNNSTKRKKERNLFLPKALLQARHVQVGNYQQLI